MENQLISIQRKMLIFVQKRAQEALISASVILIGIFVRDAAFLKNFFEMADDI